MRSGTALDLKYSVKIEEIDDSGNVIKDVGTVTRSLDKDYLPFVSKSPFALAWPGSKDLSQLMGDTGSLQPGPLQPGHLEHQLRRRPQVQGRRQPPPTAPWTRPPRPATGSP